jgi:HEAT repeat protein
MPVLSDDIQRLLEALRQPASSLAASDADPRRDCLRVLARSGEVRAVPSLLHLLPPGHPLSSDAADTIASLINGISPTQLAWIDMQARNYTYAYGHDAWWQLRPDDVARLAQSAYPSVIGLVASHPSGFVREAAVEALRSVTDGQEIPFLTLRANDWVPTVAAKAADLLASRLDPENRRSVLDALPFLVRMVGQRRQNHGRFSDAIRRVLTTDAGVDVLARVNTFDTLVRRYVYGIIVNEAASGDGNIVTAALTDRDPLVRSLAVRRLAGTGNIDSSTGSLELLLSHDRMPSVRREAVSVLARCAPHRLRDLLPRVLLDRAAAVRDLARYFVRALNAPVVPRDIYVEGLKETSTLRLAAAIAGLGESGTNADVNVVMPFLKASSPTVRRAAVRAVARLDATAAISAAVAALADPAPSVRAAAASTLRANASRVDFAAVSDVMKRLPAARSRERLLPLLSDAPKWDAAIYLLDSLADADQAVRERASLLLDAWISRFNRSQSQPTPSQLRRIREALEAETSALRDATVRELRFIAKV